MGFLWAEPGFPKQGWICINIIDLKEDDGDDEDVDYASCQACGHEQVRFVHVMTHPKYPIPIEVGCVCSGKLESNKRAAKERERVARNRSNRRGTWIASKRWKCSQNGNSYRKEGSYVVGVSPNADRTLWRPWIKHIETAKYLGKLQEFPTEVQARIALFAALEDPIQLWNG